MVRVGTAFSVPSEDGKRFPEIDQHLRKYYMNLKNISVEGRILLQIVL